MEWKDILYLIVLGGFMFFMMRNGGCCGGHGNKQQENKVDENGDNKDNGSHKSGCCH